MDIRRLSPAELKKQLRTGKIRVTIIGVGHVGLPLAAWMASKGVAVSGICKDLEEAETINKGTPPFYETGLAPLVRRAVAKGLFLAFPREKGPEIVGKSSVVFVCVGTPIDDEKRPVLADIEDAATSIGRGLKPGSLIILRSTVPPRTTETLFARIVQEKSGLVPGRDFSLAFCPERLAAGRALRELSGIPQVIGGIDGESTRVAASVFRALACRALETSGCVIAEMAKFFDNIYRDVNIALANELAIICERLGVDTMEILRACNTSPKTRVLVPGSGTGGSCLNKDPYILASEARKLDLTPEIILHARARNEEMPAHTVNIVKEAFQILGKKVETSKIAVLGLAFKDGTDDVRGTVSIPVINSLLKEGAEVTVYDPRVSPARAKFKFDGLKAGLEEAVDGADCAVILSDHEAFRRMNLKVLSGKMRHPAAIVDGRQVISPEEAALHGLYYSGVGRVPRTPATVGARA